VSDDLGNNDDYVEWRWEYNERLHKLTKEHLIMIINRFLNTADERDLTPTDEELAIILNLTEECDDDDNDE